MNNLSWLFLMADFFETMNNVGFILLILSVVGAAVYFIGKGEGFSDDEIPIKRYLLYWTFGVGLFGIVLPSQSTVYKVIVSEMGEEVIKTESMQNLFDLANQEIKKAISDNNKN